MAIRFKDGREFQCPDALVGGAWEVLKGEYDLPEVQFDTPPTVLDIGAHIGAFAAWAAARWPGCRLDCYEPNPEAFGWLEQNVPVFAPGAKIHRVGVRAESGRALLRRGRFNLGESSFEDVGGQHPATLEAGAVEVEVLDAAELPAAAVVKVDTEGSEIPILTRYVATHPAPSAVLLEYHRPEDRRQLEALLELRGLPLVRGLIRTPWRGTLCFVKCRLEPLGETGLVPGGLVPAAFPR